MSEILLARFKPDLREGRYTRTGNRDNTRGAIVVTSLMERLAISGEIFELHEMVGVAPHTHKCLTHSFLCTLGLVEIVAIKKLNPKAVKIWKE